VFFGAYWKHHTLIPYETHVDEVVDLMQWEIRRQAEEKLQWEARQRKHAGKFKDPSDADKTLASKKPIRPRPLRKAKVVSPPIKKGPETSATPGEMKAVETDSIQTKIVIKRKGAEDLPSTANAPTSLSENPINLSLHKKVKVEASVAQKSPSFGKMKAAEAISVENKISAKRKGFAKDEDPAGTIKTPPPSPRPVRKVKVSASPAQTSSPFGKMEAAEAISVENKTSAKRKGFAKDEDPPGAIETPPPSPRPVRKVKVALLSVEREAKKDTTTGASTRPSISNHGSGSDSDTNSSSNDDNNGSSDSKTDPSDDSDTGSDHTELDGTSSSRSGDGDSLDEDYRWGIDSGNSDSDGRRSLDDGNNSDGDSDDDLGEIGQMMFGESSGSRQQANQSQLADRGLWWKETKFVFEEGEVEDEEEEEGGKNEGRDGEKGRVVDGDGREKGNSLPSQGMVCFLFMLLKEKF
jgi:hypothetical protein